MGNYLKSIHVNELYHLKNFDIEVCRGEEKKHLIITGPNGTGKTILLKSVLASLEKIVQDKNLNLKALPKNVRIFQDQIQRDKEANDIVSVRRNEETLRSCEKQFEEFTKEVVLDISNYEDVAHNFSEKKFIVASYDDVRRSHFVAVKNPEKPVLSFSVKDNKVDQFLKFMVDLKIQQALANNEKQFKDANIIGEWFGSFENILKKLFNDPSLHLNFDYKTYIFTICEQGKLPYEFTQLSAGYSAALDIITDLMLKMQNSGQLVRAYDVEGIVLIDEIETHLHLALQKQILPLLIGLFPKIQFIVTTHSPFILNSVSNVTVYDLKRKTSIDDLTDYSYETLAEGYFGIETESGELRDRLRQIEELLAKKEKDATDEEKLNYLIEDLKKIPDAVAPEIKTRLSELLIENKTNRL